MATDPITETIRKQAYDAAMADLPVYVQRRWGSLPKSLTGAMTLAWLRFEAMSREEQIAIFVGLYTRSTVLAIDRANQIADSHAVEPKAVETPAA